MRTITVSCPKEGRCDIDAVAHKIVCGMSLLRSEEADDFARALDVTADVISEIT